MIAVHAHLYIVYIQNLLTSHTLFILYRPPIYLNIECYELYINKPYRDQEQLYIYNLYYINYIYSSYVAVSQQAAFTTILINWIPQS